MPVMHLSTEEEHLEASRNGCFPPRYELFDLDFFYSGPRDRVLVALEPVTEPLPVRIQSRSAFR